MIARIKMDIATRTMATKTGRNGKDKYKLYKKQVPLINM